MDMQLNVDVIKAERLKRGWSQEQLAATTGLGVRTIQRIESTGIASSESATSLSAVFEVPLERIVVASQPGTGISYRRKIYAFGSAALVAVLALAFLLPKAAATEVAMRVALSTGPSTESTMNTSAPDGKPTEIRFEKELKVVLVPRVLNDDQILLSIDVYRYEGQDFKLVSQPKILLRNRTETSLSVSMGNGQSIRLTITPDTK